MIQLLSSRFQKQVALLIIMVFAGNTVFAGRGYLFSNTKEKEKEYQYNLLTLPDINEPSLQEISSIDPGISRPEITALSPAAELITGEEKNTIAPGSISKDDKPDIGGPGQPEMSAFKSVGADNMVDLFSGDFSYNIPLGDVGGYPINIFYNSGISMDQEASWVGLGWNINPGTIMRNKRGLPDDFNGKDLIRKEMNIKPNITVGVTGSKELELAGNKPKDPGNGAAGTTGSTPSGLSSKLSTSLGLFYNNYSGIGIDFGIHTTLNLKDKVVDEKTAATDPKAPETPPVTTTTVIGGNVSLGYNINSQSGVKVTPGLGIRINESAKTNQNGTTASLTATYNSRTGLQGISLSAETRKSENIKKKEDKDDRYKDHSRFASASTLTFGVPSITPSIRMPLTHRNYNLGIGFGKEAKFTLFKNTHFSGYYSEAVLTKEDKTQTKPAFGYLYYQEANGNKDAMLDFNRLNDGVYTKNNPVMAIPNYTYDVFSISGQGIGGGFRAYRGDVGSVHDNYTRTRENASSIDLEFGVKDVAELGVNLNYIHTPTTAGEWQKGNFAREELLFRRGTGLKQSAYFKNPGEAAMTDPEFMNNLSNEDLIRIKLEDPGTRRPNALPVWQKLADGQTTFTDLPFGGEKTWKNKRDKRTQLISYLTAEEANFVGLDKKIYYYPENTFPVGNCRYGGAKEVKRFEPAPQPSSTPSTWVRKSHHLSEITVTETDGRRYVYGIPVYNLKEEEVSFNASNNNPNVWSNQVDETNQLVTYNAGDLMENKRGLDHFYQKDEIDPYAHSFLLTGLLSPDYVDVTGDGITDDDLGTSVKFNYTKIEHPSDAEGRGFGWRAPFTGVTGGGAIGSASFNRGLKTDNTDDKGHFTYGERELWYLNSIESRNMIATFTIESRSDGKAAAGEIGGVSSTLGMKKLKRIDIYSKAEWVKTGITKKPVKTIHFEYYEGSGELCNGTPDNPTGGGKLSLKSIYFTYNGNERQFKNRYYFKYHSNPGYSRMANDRWGNYKPASANASTQTGTDFSAFNTNNEDFPFADQDKTTADVNAAAWTLNEITLPSGAKIKVDFESDDYAYVQDRRASQMFRIAGFGKQSGSAPVSDLYSMPGSDNFYIFIDVPVPVTNKADIKNKYLEGLKQVYLKLWVKVPPDQFGSGFEPIPVYAKLIGDNPTDDYGKVSDNRIWIKVQRDRGNYSPMFYNSLQYLTKNLPSKAYPGSNLRNTGPLGLLKALAGLLFNQISAFGKFNITARFLSYCKTVDLTKSYIRLNNPNFKKLGGGIRVKKVTIKDNFKKMTEKPAGVDNGMPESEYGQEYDYTTTTLIGGQETVISSGVASYEPAVGAEENPFREILSYDDHQPLGPNERGAVEMPLGEVFFPSPSVGYSKVTVRSIHRNNVKSGVGRTETEFFTTRDFPTKSDFTNFDGESKVRFKGNPILRYLKLVSVEVATLSQGFRLQTNDMNGKMHKQTVFDENGKQITFTENIYRIEKAGERVFKFNNLVDVITNPAAPVQKALIGKEIEVMTDFREHTSKALTFNVDFNINVNEVGGFPVIVPTIMIPFHYAETGYRSAATLKIINTFGILEKVRHIDKGSEVSTKDLVYDAETGNVLVTETNNEFNKSVYSFNYPAHWVYKGMGGAYKNAEAVFEHLRFQNGKLTTPDFDFSVIESGDELYVKDYSVNGALNEPGCYPSGPVQYIPKPLDPDDPTMFVRKIWALDMRKDPANTEQKFLFIDKNGEPYSGGDVTVKIIRSGKRNLVSASVGAFTSLVNPIKKISSSPDVYQLSATDETKIINTTANTFKENWRVDEAWYSKETITQTSKSVPIRKLKLFPIKNYNLLHYNTSANSFSYVHSPDHPNTNAYYTSFREPRGGGGDNPLPIRYYKETNNWVLFDFQALPAGAKIYNAKLSLLTHSDLLGVCFNPTDAYGTHLATQPQRANLNEISDNRVEIRRMLSPWYTNSQTMQWEDLLNNNSKVDLNTIAMIQNVGNTNRNFEATYNGSGQIVRDDRIEMTSVIRDMVKDIRGNGLNYAYGIRLQMNDDIRTYGSFLKQQCFSTLSSNCANSFLEVYYYDCNESESADLGYGLFNCGTTTSQTTLCISRFTGKRMNPYTNGVLGNWKADIGYVYYDNRREADASQPTAELSKGGVIGTGYQSFWTPVSGGSMIINNDGITGVGGSPAKWKWSSMVTQFNSKGFELENTDPLKRFNCGIYGYDKSLPVAVANNSKLRNAAYDGFEDYEYQSNNCAPYCKTKRHMVIENAATHLDHSVVHSGASSLKVAAGESVSIKAPVTAKEDDEKTYGIRISTVTTTMTGTWVNPAGTGLNGKYYNFGPDYKNFIETISHWHRRVRNDAEDRLDNNTGYTYQLDPYIRKQSNGNYDYFMNPGIRLPAGIGNREGVDGNDYYCTRWEGYVQVPETGVYKFKVASDDGMKLFIDGTPVDLGEDYFYNHPPNESLEYSTPVWNVGSHHTIRVDYYEEEGESTAMLFWKIPSAANFEIVPKDYLYPGVPNPSTVINGTYDCIKPDEIKVKDNALTDVFSPLQGQKMVFSAWVKEEADDCHCTNYGNNAAQIYFDNSTTATFTLVPSGKIIEGWQRYDAVFDIPAAATSMEIKLKSTGTKIVYWDDVRLHPFNANMKSFVYHPVTLRLMADMDENNYCSFYEYDDDGTLIRVKKETERGIKTITETRSALQKRITE